jgi:hypothetical protein
MICGNCGHEWDMQYAHVIKIERLPEGCKEQVQCPKCGIVEEVFRPDIGACNGD